MTNRLYPVTIIRSRYKGAYSGGSWLAFYCDPEDIPPEATADDGTCAAWFHSDPAAFVGRGSTPDGAYNDLRQRHANNEPPGYMKIGFGLDYSRGSDDA